jgi:cell pole-organizing protein PopZ
MEDILASIRRIIVDDDDKAAMAQDASGTADDVGHDDDDDDVLELTELADDEAAVSEADSVDRPSILDITASPDDPEAEADQAPASDEGGWRFAETSQPDNDGAEETMANKPDDNDNRLMSRDTATSAATSLSSLARASDPDPLHGVPKGRPVEELVMDALKPMMSEWLNEHLPAIVERIVEREVRYLSRRPEDD